VPISLARSSSSAAAAITVYLHHGWASRFLSVATGAHHSWLCCRRAPDILARLIGQWLSDRLGQPFVIENRPGASGRIAIETVIKRRGRLYAANGALPDAVNATLFQNPNYSFVRDIARSPPSAVIPTWMLVNQGFPPNRSRVIAYAKANPGKINTASPGVGSSPHMASELFKFMTGIDMTHVGLPRTAPALPTARGSRAGLLRLFPHRSHTSGPASFGALAVTYGGARGRATGYSDRGRFCARL